MNDWYDKGEGSEHMKQQIAKSARDNPVPNALCIGCEHKKPHKKPRKKGSTMGPIVEIIVTGDVGAGKTTISQLIEKALRSENLSNYTLVDEECLVKDETFSRRIEALKQKKVEIKITVEQLSRTEMKNLRGSEE
jgi:hypothetical protein